MTMLFFSPDGSEVEGVARNLQDAGIPCEVRNGPFPDNMFPYSSDAELWVHNDRDYYRALMLFVELGIGFAKRNIQTPPPAES